mgnify:CR=1 FL=1
MEKSTQEISQHTTLRELGNIKLGGLNIDISGVKEEYLDKPFGYLDISFDEVDPSGKFIESFNRVLNYFGYFRKP